MVVEVAVVEELVGAVAELVECCVSRRPHRRRSTSSSSSSSSSSGSSRIASSCGSSRRERCVSSSSSSSSGGGGGGGSSSVSRSGRSSSSHLGVEVWGCELGTNAPRREALCKRCTCNVSECRRGACLWEWCLAVGKVLGSR